VILCNILVVALLTLTKTPLLICLSLNSRKIFLGVGGILLIPFNLITKTTLAAGGT